mmetsp:Transcript_65513/g.213319  ORF Transcript_65513/g.213319 Transcript_65513/m.213319 type:complete len:253 (+) Transcript_65513:149-907(+)
MRTPNAALHLRQGAEKVSRALGGRSIRWAPRTSRWPSCWAAATQRGRRTWQPIAGSRGPSRLRRCAASGAPSRNGSEVSGARAAAGARATRRGVGGDVSSVRPTCTPSAWRQRPTRTPACTSISCRCRAKATAPRPSWTAARGRTAWRLARTSCRRRCSRSGPPPSRRTPKPTLRVADERPALFFTSAIQHQRCWRGRWARYRALWCCGNPSWCDGWQHLWPARAARPQCCREFGGRLCYRCCLGDITTARR